MTEDRFEPSNEAGPEDHQPVTPALPRPEVTGAPAAPTPPSGVPTGAYALGALAGNPRLGAPSGPGSGPPPLHPGPPYWGPPPGATPPPAASHRLRNAALVTGAAVIALAGGIGIGHAAWTNNPAPLSASHTINPTTPGYSGSNGFPFGSGPSGTNGSGSGSSGGAGPSDVSAIAAKVDPGLVDIDTTLGYQQDEAAGTGMVLTPSGEILTNNHVIEGATTISVTDVGNGKTYSASVVGYDRTKDIAVLQLHGASGLQTASLGNSSNVAVGEDIVGIGNAGGSGGTPSAVGGTVTALNQSITASDEADASSEQLTGLIETNADIQAGDSGGPLVTTSGQVVGIDTAASAGFSFQSSQGSSGNQGYSIPINEATSIAKEMESGSSSSTVHIGATAFLGVEVAQGSCDAGGGNGYGGYGGYGGGYGGYGGGASNSGTVVCQVITSSPAQESGLAEGDVITSVDGRTVSTPSDLTNLLEPYHPGDKVTIGWTDSSGQPHTASVDLTSGPPQ